jgi:hypothetical protein
MKFEHYENCAWLMENNKFVAKKYYIDGKKIIVRHNSHQFDCKFTDGTDGWECSCHPAITEARELRWEDTECTCQDLL